MESTENSKRKSRMKYKEQLLLILALGVTLLGVIYSQNIFSWLTKLKGILSPLILGSIFAYILNLIYIRLEKIYFPRSRNRWLNRTRKPVCILLSIVLILLVLTLIINLVIPKLIQVFSAFLNVIPTVYQEVEAFINENIDIPLIEAELNNLDMNWQGIREQILDYIRNIVAYLINSAAAIIGDITSGLFDFFIAFSFALYLLISKEKLMAQMKLVMRAFLPARISRVLKTVGRTAHECFSSFIVGQVTEAFILGALCMLGMWILRFPYAVPIGALVGVTALIPVFGALLGEALGTVLILSVSPLQAVLFLAFILILQQLENNLIYPKVVGSSIGLPGIWVLAAITIGSGFGGILGMLVSVPVTATLYKLLKMAVANKLSNTKAASDM